MTVGLNIFSSTKENGLLVEYIPALESLQNSLSKIDQKVDAIQETTLLNNEALNLQNLSYQGKMIALNPESRQDFLKNAYIFYNNSSYKEAKDAIESYISKGDTTELDVAELYYQFLKNNVDDPLEYLNQNYGSDDVAIIYTIYNHQPINIKNATLLAKLAVQNDNSLPLQFLLADYYWALKENMTIDMWFYNDEVWANIKKAVPKNMESWFYGKELSFKNVSEEKWDLFYKGFTPPSYKMFQPTQGLFLKNFIGFYFNPDSKICLYKKYNYFATKTSYFQVLDKKSNTYVKLIAEGLQAAEAKCSANISGVFQGGLKDLQTLVNVKYIDSDDKQYGPWVLTAQETGKWTAYDFSTIDFKVQREYKGKIH
jgi:hypothetical protein